MRPVARFLPCWRSIGSRAASCSACLVRPDDDVVAVANWRATGPPRRAGRTSSRLTIAIEHRLAPFRRARAPFRPSVGSSRICGKVAAHLPGAEERSPVDVGHAARARHVVDHRADPASRRGRSVAVPAAVEARWRAPRSIGRSSVAGLLRDRPRASFPDPARDVRQGRRRPRSLRQQVRHHADRLGGVLHMQHPMLVFRRDLQRGVLLRGRGPADQQRQGRSPAASSRRPRRPCGRATGVMRPERPMMSAFSSFARSRGCPRSGTITPRSTTS